MQGQRRFGKIKRGCGEGASRRLHMEGNEREARVSVRRDGGDHNC